MSGRSPPLYCTLILITMHSHQSYPNITTVIHSYEYSTTVDNSTIETYRKCARVQQQAGGSAATVHRTTFSIAAQRGAFVPTDFCAAIQGIPLFRVSLLGTVDCNVFLEVRRYVQDFNFSTNLGQDKMVDIVHESNQNVLQRFYGL